MAMIGRELGKKLGVGVDFGTAHKPGLWLRLGTGMRPGLGLVIGLIPVSTQL